MPRGPCDRGEASAQHHAQHQASGDGHNTKHQHNITQPTPHNQDWHKEQVSQIIKVMQ